MSIILSKVLKWVWGKIVLLVLIVIILATAAWIKSEMRSIDQKKDDTAKMTRQAESLISEAADYEAQMQRVLDEISILVSKLDAAGAVRQAAWEKVAEAEAEVARAKADLRWYETRWTHPAKHARVKLAETKSAGLRELAKAADKAWSEAKSEVESTKAGKEAIKLQNSAGAKRHEAARLRERSEAILASISQSLVVRTLGYVKQVFPVAAWTLAGIIFAPVLIRSTLYFAVAPWITRAKPVRILPESRGHIETSAAAVSVPVPLSPGDELIVHPDFLQAAGTTEPKHSRLLLSWKMPLTSLAAGLYMLVSIRNRGTGETRVTVSPKTELFGMVGEVNIPEGAAMVVYPRSLVGMVLREGRKPRITRHWRIRSLHSWITFQFRFLVIHGEAKLLIKGCRGFRTENVTPDKPRMQDQEATLGFSANLEYSGVRCETFLSYLRGVEELFNDRFSGADGIFLAEESQHFEHKAGTFRRGLEGLTDGFLKAFGI